MDDADLIARSADPAGPVGLLHTDPLTRFVAGACRATGAVAGALIVALADDEAPPAIHGCVAHDEEADAALSAFLTAEMPASGWARNRLPAGHAGLSTRITFAEGAGRLTLVFARDALTAPDAMERCHDIAEALAIAAGAMLDTWVDQGRVSADRDLLASAIQQSECGIIIVGGDHGVVFSNAAADVILSARDGMELRRGQLRPTRYQDAIRFQAALDHVMTLPPKTGRTSEQGMMMMLSRDDAARRLIAVIAPIGGGKAATREEPGEGAAIVYVMRPECSGLRGVEAICHLHGLSPVETQLVAQLVAGLTLAEAATEMRIKPDTARAYLKQAFAKTDTHRQADLIQLVLRYQRAVRGDVVFHAA